MNESTYIATTYLRLLRSDTELTRALESELDGKLNQVLESEYIYGDTIRTIFQLFADQGLDSWLLRFGQHLSVGSHGPLGFAVLSAPNLGTAIDVLTEFSCIRTSAYRSKSIRRGKRVSFITEDQTGHPLIGQWLVESSIRVAQKLIEAVMAHPLSDLATIRFSHSKPDYYNELDAFFGTTINYNCEVNSIDIPSSWCRMSSPLSDPDAFKANLQKCRELKLKLANIDDIVEATRLDLNHYFQSRIMGQAFSYDMPTLEQLAKKHHCSARTYARRLNCQRQSYKQLLEECRRHHAMELLTNTHTSIADISLQLNLSLIHISSPRDRG